MRNVKIVRRVKKIIWRSTQFRRLCFQILKVVSMSSLPTYRY